MPSVEAMKTASVVCCTGESWSAFSRYVSSSCRFNIEVEQFTIFSFFSFFRSFLGDIVHYIFDATLVKKCAALASQRFYGRHTYNVLVSALCEVFAELNLMNTVSLVVTDNDYNLTDFEHVCCNLFSFLVSFSVYSVFKCLKRTVGT